MNKPKAYYSVVIPVYNEQGNIEKLNQEIKQVMTSLRQNYEIIYVNDGSTDSTLNELKKLKKIKIIDLNKNYGQSTALDAGFKMAEGEIIISMDGDLQNNPEDIPKLLKKLKDDDLDVVAGWRKHRADKSGIKVLTLLGRFARKVFIKDNIHDTGCTLRVYKQKAAKSLDLQGEMHRYILALLRWKGFRIGEIIVEDRKRKSGVSKYGYSKAIRGFLDLIYVWFIKKYSQRPLHIFGYLSILSFFLGAGIEALLMIKKVFFRIDLSDNAWFILGFFLLGLSFVSFVFGMIFEMMIKIQLNTSPCEKRYHIREVWRG